MANYIRDMTDRTPFEGDYTGRDEIGLPTCAHVYRRFRGETIAPIPCMYYAEHGKWCNHHASQARRNESN